MAPNRSSVALRLVLVGTVLLSAAIVWRLLSEQEPDRELNPPAFARGAGGGMSPPAGGAASPALTPVPGIKTTGSTPIFTSTELKLQPPIGTKVRDVVAQLMADADAGVPSAACRVGTELARCWQNRELSRIRESQLRRLSNAGSAEGEQISRSAADLWERTARDRELCEGVSDQLIEQGWRYLLDAGLKGNVAAMEQFAMNPPLSSDVLSSLDGWTAYRDFGPMFLQRSLEAGSVRALYLAFFSAATGMGPGGHSLVPRDPYQAVVYGNAALSLVDSGSAQMITAALPGLVSEAGARSATAVQEGQILRDRFFRSSSVTQVSSDLGVPQPGNCVPQ